MIGPAFTLKQRFDLAPEFGIFFEECRTLLTVPDFQPVLRGELYGPLRDPAVFSRAALDPEVDTLVWPNGADFDPATLHDWPRCREAFIEMARRWETVSA